MVEQRALASVVETIALDGPRASLQKTGDRDDIAALAEGLVGISIETV